MFKNNLIKIENYLKLLSLYLLLNILTILFLDNEPLLKAFILITFALSILTIYKIKTQISLFKDVNYDVKDDLEKDEDKEDILIECFNSIKYYKDKSLEKPMLEKEIEKHKEESSDLFIDENKKIVEKTFDYIMED
ncbi:MAG: hypothetical protein GX889_03385 [Clostridiales bacterium]|nr:hypothetical protein [Clostridiales bacterium]